MFPVKIQHTREVCVETGREMKGTRREHDGPREVVATWF